MRKELQTLLMIMRYRWNLEGESHIRIFPDGHIEVWSERGDNIVKVAQFDTIEQLEQRIKEYNK